MQIFPTFSACTHQSHYILALIPSISPIKVFWGALLFNLQMIDYKERARAHKRASVNVCEYVCVYVCVCMFVCMCVCVCI